MATVTKTTTLVTEGNIYGAGSIHWSDIGDMTTCGSGAGNISTPAVGYVYTPICTDFDFALAPTDVITKIEVKITGTQDGASYLDWCSLMWNGTPSLYHCFNSDVVDPLDGSSHTATLQPTTSGDPDLWGVVWTPAMVNDVTFGCAFDMYHSSGDTINIDCVQITITYTPDGEQPSTVCDGVHCDEFMDMNDAIKALAAKYLSEPLDCTGFKAVGGLKKCTDLTDLTQCAEKYTLEQALKAALTNDGCDGWALRVWVLPPEDGGFR